MSHKHIITEAERARIEQIDRLVAIGRRGVRELISDLTDPSWTVRRALVASLASLGDDAVPALCAWLRDARTDENAIAAAVDALSSSIGSTVTDHVLALVDDPNPQVVADAAQILGRRRAAAATSTLARLVEHDNDNVAVAAIEALGVIGGTAAVEALIRAIDSKRFFRTYPAIQVLSRTGDPRSVPPLAALLVDETYRIEVVRALGRTGMAQAIGPIMSLLSSPSDAIVRLVAVALSDLIQRAEWTGSAEHVEELMRPALTPWLSRIAAALRGADADERLAIAHLFGRAGDASVLPVITTMLDDAVTAAAATSALEHLGRASDDAFVIALFNSDAARRAMLLPLVRAKHAGAAVRGLLHDEDAEVRARACEALARIGDIASVPALFEQLGDPSPRAAHAAVSAILALGSSETESLALAAAQSGRASVRRHAIRILGALGFSSAFEPLRAAIADSDRRIAELAIAGLGAIEDARSEDVLAHHASSPDDALRSAVMRAAGHRGGPSAVKLLTKGIADPSPWVRYYAAQALGRVDAEYASRASELLIQHLPDPAPQVRIAVLEALSRLESPEAWQAVCRAAASSDPDERRAGLVGVGMQARRDGLAILLEAAKSPDPANRLVAASGLTRFDDPRALAALEEALADPTPEVRAAALSLLSERDDDAAAQVLVHCALRVDPEDPVQRALSRPGASRTAAILSALSTADDRGAPILVAALARMRADHALFEALAMSNPAARAGAASALVATGAEGALQAVSTLARQDADPEVRRVCSAIVTTS